MYFNSFCESDIRYPGWGIIRYPIVRQCFEFASPIDNIPFVSGGRQSDETNEIFQCDDNDFSEKRSSLFNF